MNHAKTFALETSARYSAAKRGLSRLLVLLIALTLMNAAGFAQAVSGDLFGTVQDPNGAAIPSAVVEVTNTATGVKRSTTANANGEYRFTNLPIGTYDVKASSSGLTAAADNVRVELNKSATLPLVARVSQASTTVEVNSDIATTDTVTPQLQNTYEKKQLQDLPTASVGFGVLNLSLLGAGVASNGGVGVGTGPTVGGQRPRNNNFTLEGVDNNNKSVTGPLITVPNDAVANFTILQNQYSPEFGHSSGGQFNTVVQSGTNHFHGRVYDYLQNRTMNAIDAATARGVAHPKNAPFDNNRYGGQIGGPILPNKLFFFANYEYNPINQGVPQQGCSPTPAGFAALAGASSAFAPANYQTFVKYHLPAATADTTGVCGTAGTAASTTVTGPGGSTVVVPIGLLNLSGLQQQRSHQVTTSLDYNLSDSDQLRGRYIFFRLNQNPYVTDAPFFPTFNTIAPFRNHLLTLSEYHTFTPHVNNEFRIGFNRYYNVETAGKQTFPGLAEFPNIQIDEFGTNIGPPPNSPQLTVQNLYQAVNNVSWAKGNHNFKFGIEGRKYISPQQFTQRQRGDYQYATLDEFLQDLAPSDFGERSTGAFAYYGDQISIYSYANDIWRITPKLSLNLGLRHEYTTVPVGERLQALNAAASVPGLIEFRAPRAQTKNFAPRVGFAYTPDGRGDWSIRAGFGISYDVLFDNLGTLSFPPQLSSTLDVGAQTPNFLANGGLTAASGLPGATVSPSGFVTYSTVANQRAATSGFIPDQHVPYSEQWNLGFQHLFAKSFVFEARYLGTRGIHLPVQDRLNRQSKTDATHFLPTFLNNPGQAALDSLPNTLASINARSNFVPAYAAAGFTGQNVIAFAPYGSSIYHGLATQLTRNFTNGLQFQAAYTWSHLLDDSTAEVFSTLLTPRRPQDFQNVGNDRSTSALDRRHRLTVSGIYDLPFFKNSNWFTKNLVGNWEVAPVYTFQSPEYATVQSQVDTNLNGDSFGDRAIFNPSGVKGTGSGVTALTNSAGQTVAYLANNPNAQYIVAGKGARANASRNTLPLPRTNNWDLTLVKRIGLGESRSFEFQAQALNLFNHSQYVPGSLNQINLTGFTNQSVRNFLTPGDPTFNRPELVFPNNARAMQLVAKFSF